MQTKQQPKKPAYSNIRCTPLKPLLFALLAITLSPSSLSAIDRLYPANGVTASGKIKSISPEQIVIEVRGKEQKYATADVERIQFDGEPSNLSRAKEMIFNEQYDDAAAELKKVDQKRLGTKRLQGELYFFNAYLEGQKALTGNGDAAKAINALRAYQSNEPKSHHFYDLATLLGQLALAANEPDKAERYFSVVARSTNDQTKFLGQYYLGNSFAQQNKNKEAIETFKQVLQTTPQNPAMIKTQRLAEVGIADSTASSGDVDTALKSLNQLVNDVDSTDGSLHAKIQIARGKALMKKGDSQAALLAFLRIDTLFSYESASHAEALFHLSKLWGDIGRPQQAASAKSRLSTLYAGSKWNQK